MARFPPAAAPLIVATLLRRRDESVLTPRTRGYREPSHFRFPGAAAIATFLEVQFANRGRECRRAADRQVLTAEADPENGRDHCLAGRAAYRFIRARVVGSALE
jgi:hypothetical protein